MRVSERHRYWVADRRMGSARKDHVDTLNTLSTQKRINTISDDPVGAVRSIGLRKDLNRSEDLKKNIDFAKSFIDVTESALNQIGDKLIRAQELAIAMSNDTFDGANREITGKELRQLLDEVINLANTRYGDKYVFSGFRHGQPAMDLNGNFLGDDGEIFLQIGRQSFKKINIPGRGLFLPSAEEQGAGHTGLVPALQSLLVGLESNDKDVIHYGVDELTHQLSKITNFQASSGALWSALESATGQVEYQEQQAQHFISENEDADIFKATSDFKRAESVLQSTLQATNKLLQPSLLNFLS